MKAARVGRWRIVLATLCMGLVGCGVEYEVQIDNVLTPEGTLQRHISFEEAKGRRWQRFAQPQLPYRETAPGSYSAELPPGTSNSGWSPFVEYSDSKFESGSRTSSGTVSLSVEDIVVGKLYRYHEKLETGVDRDAFLRELPSWLDLGADILARSILELAPDVEADALRTRLREKYLPESRVGVPELRERLGEVGRKYNAGILFHREFEALQGVTEYWEKFAARLGLRCKTPGESLANIDQYFSDRRWDWNGFLVAEFLALGVTEDRAEEISTTLRSGALEHALKRVTAELFATEEERSRKEREIIAFCRAGLGICCFNIFDSYDVVVKAQLPGRVLVSNGDLTSSPAVVWQLKFLVADSPTFHALSFLPESWVPAAQAEQLTRGELGEMHERFQKLSSEQRQRVQTLLASGFKHPAQWQQLTTAAGDSLTALELQVASATFDTVMRR